jgi:hypothetical protein
MAMNFKELKKDWFKKPDSGTLIVTAGIFIWIAIVNILVTSVIFPAIGEALTKTGKFAVNTPGYDPGTWGAILGDDPPTYSLASWPIFFVTIFYYVMGGNKKKIPEILCGGLFGLGMALLLFVGVWTIMGQSALANGTSAETTDFAIAFIPVIVVILAIVIMGGTVAPLFCNNIAFGYMTIATVQMGRFLWYPWLSGDKWMMTWPVGPTQGPAYFAQEIGMNALVFLVGGAVILGGCWLIEKYMIKWLTKRAIAKATAAAAASGGEAK